MYTPKFIAQSFVKQYYEILSTKPQELHKFYFSQASFLHSEAASIEDSVIGTEAIRNKVLQLNLSGAQIDLSKGSVDFQELNSSDINRILVVVVGVITAVEQSPKQFTQSFVLAGQHNNYFVNNSVFRLLGEFNQTFPVEVDSVVAPTTVASVAAVESVVVEVTDVPVPVSEEIEVVVEETTESTAETPETVESKAESAEAAVIEVVVVEESPLENAADDVEVEVEVESVSVPEPTTTSSSSSAEKEVVSAAAVASGAPKSYLDIVKKIAGDAAPSKDTTATTNGYRTYKTAKPTATSAAAPPAATTVASASTESSPPVEGKFKYTPNYHDINKATGQQLFSVYVSNLPETVTETLLQQAFSQFGNVAQVDITRGKKYAFVKFDSIESMQAALDYDKEIDVSGTVLRVEERTKSVAGKDNKDLGKEKKQFRKFRDGKEQDANTKEGTNGGEFVSAKDKKIQRKDDKFRNNNSKVEKDYKKEPKKEKNIVETAKK